jgi:F-type H+-transporting ATPase subunit beta
MTDTTTEATLYGKVVQIIGPVLDVEFENQAALPEIYTALTIEEGEGDNKVSLVAEVAQEIGRNQVRAVAMSSTDGVVRGMKVVNTGGPITVPVGEECLGRVFNLFGDPVDNLGPVAAKQRRPIHASAPKFQTLTTRTELFETGIKVIDLLAPYAKGGKPVRRCRCRQDRHHPGAHQQRRPAARWLLRLLWRGRAQP